MKASLLKKLQAVDTPTVCNAIEVAQGKRGFNAFSRGTMLSSAPEEGAIVGYARTAQIAALVPPSDDPGVIKARRMAYYQHMADGAKQSITQGISPAIAVVEDVDYPHAIGAYWGEINTNVHKGFGMKGALTNGVMRDLGDMPSGFPVIAGSIGPSHGFVHVRTIGEPVEIFGMRVCNGDLVHADRHGAVVIPDDIVPVLEAAIDKLLATEQVILESTKDPDFNFDKFALAWAEFEKSRT